VALKDLYGIAQDIHSRLSNLTSVAETQRFMPAIIVAYEALCGADSSGAKHEPTITGNTFNSTTPK
jgi:hypothetical protein